MSGRKLRSARIPLGGAASSLPKRGGRKQVDDAEKPATKRAKATANVSSSNEDDEGSREADPQPVKGKTKAKGTGKAKKGKKTRCVASFYVHCPPPLTTLSRDRMKAAERAAKDNIENEKGVPAHLTP